MNIFKWLPWKKEREMSGTFIVKTGTVTDNGGTLIVFSDDSNRYCEVVPDTRSWLKRFGGVWIFNNPFYEFHPDDANYFGAEEEGG